jgi:hypothetical protein
MSDLGAVAEVERDSFFIEVQPARMGALDAHPNQPRAQRDKKGGQQ